MIKKRQTSAKMARIISVHTAVRLIIIHFEAMAYENTKWRGVMCSADNSKNYEIKG